MLDEAERKKKEIEKEKHRKKEEREQKTREKEEEKRKRDARRKGKGKGKLMEGKGKLTEVKGLYKNVESSDDSNSDDEMMHVRTAASTQGNSESSDSEVSEVPCQRPRRSRTMPACFRGDSDLSDV